MDIEEFLPLKNIESTIFSDQFLSGLNFNFSTSTFIIEIRHQYS